MVLSAYPSTNSSGSEKNDLFSSHENASDAKPQEATGPQTTTAEYNVERKSLSQKLLESQADLRDFIANKVADIYDILKELDKAADSQKVLTLNVDKVPHFADPFYIGKFNKTYKLADMQYRNVKVHGMSNFKDYVMSIDSPNRKVNLILLVSTTILLHNTVRPSPNSRMVTLIDPCVPSYLRICFAFAG